MLLMKKVYFDAIRSGAKQTTLRYWRHMHVRPGSVHTIRGLGAVRIEAVRSVEWADLTDADARADGFDDLPALKSALAQMYPPKKRRGRTLWRVHFTFLHPD